jgi:hypothetical protein
VYSIVYKRELDIVEYIAMQALELNGMQGARKSDE